MKHFPLILLLLLAVSCTNQTLQILVGTYTEGTSAEGVYLYSYDAKSAAAELVGMAPSGNPSFVIASPDGRRAYAVNEYNDGRQGVSAFSIEDGTIQALESLPIPKDVVDGADPCNLLYTGGALLSSNYTGGSLSAFPLDAEGRIGEISQWYAGAAEGSRVPHMHCSVISPDGKFIFATDLGRDRVYRFERGSGACPLGEETVAWQNESGSVFGPRHMVFSADGRFAYLLCELGDMLVVFSYADGILTPIQTLEAYDGKGHGSADLHLSPDGRFLYTSHRLKEDGIAIYSVNRESGEVARIGYQPTGRHPRNFAISPDGRFLLCACRDDNRIEIYGIDRKTGALSPTGRTIELGAPVCVQFL